MKSIQKKEEKQSIFNKIKLWLRAFFIRLGFCTLAIGTCEEAIKNYNSIKYEKEIEDYDQKIEEYAKAVNSFKLDDIQVFMKVIEDMWEHTKGYEEPEKNISGFSELDISREDGYGICRNMANDVAKKLNKINAEYNAITVRVLSQKYKYNPNNKAKDNIKNFRNNIEGDHMVVLTYIQKDNLILMIDPTWKTLGVCQNGEIIVFYSDSEEIVFDIKEFFSLLDIDNCNFYETLVEGSKHYIKSFEQPRLTYQEIKSKYGIQAQQIALSELSKLKDKNNMEQKDYDEREVFLADVKLQNITAGVSQDLIPKINYKDTQEKDENVEDYTK